VFCLCNSLFLIFHLPATTITTTTITPTHPNHRHAEMASLAFSFEVRGVVGEVWWVVVMVVAGSMGKFKKKRVT